MNKTLANFARNRYIRNRSIIANILHIGITIALFNTLGKTPDEKLRDMRSLIIVSEEIRRITNDFHVETRFSGELSVITTSVFRHECGLWM